MMMKYGKAFLLTFLFYTVLGCGYHLAGTGSSLPQHIQTIGVPVFTNNTQGYQVEQKITSEVTSLLIQRGKYKVVPQDKDVDALLSGTITSVSLLPAQVDSSGRATQYNVIITAKVTFKDMIDKKILFTNPGFTFRQQYNFDPNAVAYFNTQSGAVDKIAKDFADAVVSAILEGF